MDSLIKILLEDDKILQTSQTKPLVDAIVNRHPISFYYSGPRKPKKDSVLPGKRMNGEAVALGLSKKGNLIIRVFVPSPNVSKKGFNKTNWRTFMVSRMKNIEINNEKTFDLNRPQYKSGDDDLMTVTYVTSDKTKQPEIKPKEKVTKVPITKPTSVSEPKPVVEPVTKPEVKSTEPTPQELPQPKPVKKPEPPKEDPLKVEPNMERPPAEEPTQELPQTKEKETPDDTPEVDKLQESIKRIKDLMF